MNALGRHNSYEFKIMPAIACSVQSMPQFTAAGSVLVALVGILWQQGFVSDTAAVKVVELVSAL